MYCACFQIMYGQYGSVSDANARLLKMSAFENTIPVSTVFIGKLLASSGTSPYQSMSKMRRWCCGIGHGAVFRCIELNLFGIHVARPRAALSMLNSVEAHPPRLMSSLAADPGVTIELS